MLGSGHHQKTQGAAAETSDVKGIPSLTAKGSNEAAKVGWAEGS